MHELIAKLAIPAAIVFGCIVLAFAYYTVETNKNAAIQRHQSLEDEKKVLEGKREECASLSPGVRAKWNNVMGVTYDAELWEECVVTYTNTETGEVETSPLRLMQDVP